MRNVNTRSLTPSPFRRLYVETAVPALQAELKRSNPRSLPRVAKVVVAAGTGKRRAEPKFLEQVATALALLTGQKPASRVARTSIAGFKVRAGQPVGLLVTLRGRRMEDFLLRFLRVALPRLRDFRGIPLTAVDRQGNLSVGMREASVFPEVDPARIDVPLGLQVTVVPSARNRAEAVALYRALGFPLAEESRPLPKVPVPR